MYQALYRKYRPRTFDDVVGQRAVTETLKTQIETERTSHAYLFIGVRGTGKTSCAKILARALNCESPENGNPCNKCKSCVGIESGGVMDVVEIDAASNNGVENVRALREEAIYSPASVKKRVYIIDEVHMLSTSAFNALLKILEEPPEHLVFILATTEVHKVLPTIMSRCQRYSFKRISPEAIAERLESVAKSEGIALESDAAALLSRLADGSLRDGLSLLDQCAGEQSVTTERVLSAMGLAGNYRVAALLESIAEGSSAEAIEQFESLWRDGKSPATLLGELSALLRDILMLSVAPKGGKELLSGGFDDKTLNELKDKISPREAMEYMTVIQNYAGGLRDGRDPRIEAELCIIGLCEPQLMDTPERLGLRVSKLEKAVSAGAPPARPTPSESAKSFAPPPEEEDEPPFDIPADTEETAPDAVKPAPPAEIPDPEPDTAPEEEMPEPELPKSEQSENFASDDSSDLWPGLYAELKTAMPPPMFAHLSGASGKAKNGTFVISVRSGFQKAALEKAAPTELIKAAILKLSGAPMLLSITETAPDPEAKSKLDRLSEFGNIKFE